MDGEQGPQNRAHRPFFAFFTLKGMSPLLSIPSKIVPTVQHAILRCPLFGQSHVMKYVVVGHARWDLFCAGHLPFRRQNYDWLRNMLRKRSWLLLPICTERKCTFQPHRCAHISYCYNYVYCTYVNTHSTKNFLTTCIILVIGAAIPELSSKSAPSCSYVWSCSRPFALLPTGL